MMQKLLTSLNKSEWDLYIFVLALFYYKSTYRASFRHYPNIQISPSFI